jgi:hypothetical protein
VKTGINFPKQSWPDDLRTDAVSVAIATIIPANLSFKAHFQLVFIYVSELKFIYVFSKALLSATQKFVW